MVSFPPDPLQPAHLPPHSAGNHPPSNSLGHQSKSFQVTPCFPEKISIWPLRHIAWCLQVVLQQGQVNTAHWLVSLSRCLLSLPRRPFSLAVSSTWNGVPSSPSGAGGSETICVLQSHHLSAFNEPQFICDRWNRVFGGWKLVKAAWEGRLPHCSELLLRFTLLADHVSDHKA